jgi:DNA-binding GntR family transcriptional regulator
MFDAAANSAAVERTPAMPEDARSAVTDALRAAILRGEYAPSQRLVEIDLCERLGTSRFILRSALQELSGQGLVEFQRNRGARVRDISLDEAIEITEVRILLEGHLAARAADRVTKADALTLRKIVRDMRSAVQKSELLSYSDLNARLHETIREMAAHETTARLLRQLRDQTVRHQFSLSLVPGRPTVSLPQHEAIVAAITSRDPDAAQFAMHEHLQSVVQAFQALSLAAAQGAPGRDRQSGGKASR